MNNDKKRQPKYGSFPPNYCGIYCCAYSCCTGGSSATRTKKINANQNIVPFPRTMVEYAATWYACVYCTEAHPRHEQRKETSTEIWFLFPQLCMAYAAAWYVCSYCTGGSSATRTKKRDVNRNMVPFSPIWHNTAG